MIISGTMPLIYVNIGTQISVLNAINGDSQSRFTSGGIYIPSCEKEEEGKKNNPDSQDEDALWERSDKCLKTFNKCL